MRAFIIALSLFICALLIPTGPALADETKNEAQNRNQKDTERPAAPKPSRYYFEARGGVLEHDVRGLWAGTSVEVGEDANLELLSRPLRLAPRLPGGLRFQIGVSANNRGYTSKAYAGGFYELESRSGFFAGIGLGAATHNGQLVYRGSRYLNLDQSLGTRSLYTFYFLRATLVFHTIQHNRKELGARNLFRIPVEAGFALHDRLRISLLFDHISNGYLAWPNEGLDTLGFRIGIRI